MTDEKENANGADFEVADGIVPYDDNVLRERQSSSNTRMADEKENANGADFEVADGILPYDDNVLRERQSSSNTRMADEKENANGADFEVADGIVPYDDNVLREIFAAKQGDPNRFQSFWEMDEEGVDEASMEEIQKDPVKKTLWAAENGLLDTVKSLLEADQDLVHSRDEDGYTPLHRASYNGHVDTVVFLIKSGADIHAQTDDGWRPLHSAARWNQAAVLSVLLQYGSEINAQTKGGQTALHFAASDKENRESLEVLLMDKDIDAKLTNSVGETAYDICRRTSENCLLFEIMEDCVNQLKPNS